MAQRPPEFPPLLTGHRVSEGASPFRRAVKGAARGTFGAGDLLWSENRNTMDFALVLEPEVARERCGEMLLLVMVAFADAVGAIAPPEISVTYRWPSLILMNDARVGLADLEIAGCSPGDVPAWMVVRLMASIRPETMAGDPGKIADRTTMWDEGCGDISRTALIESTSRHIVNWIHTWSEDGFRPVHELWWQRRFERAPVAGGIMPDALSGAPVLGLDEHGNALVRDKAGTLAIPIDEALQALRVASR